MAQIYSNGTGGGDWSAGATWGGGSVPSSSDEVFVLNGDTVTVDASADWDGDGQSITIEGTLTVASTAGGWSLSGVTVYLYATGTLDINVDLTIDSSVAGEVGVGAGTFTCAASLTVEATASFADFITDGGTLTFDATSGTPTLTTNGVTLPGFTVNNNGVTSFEAADAVTASSWKMTAGKYNDGGFAHNIAGDILDEGGSLVSTGVWTMTANGEVEGGTFTELAIAAGVTATITENTVAVRLSGGGDLSSSGVQSFFLAASEHDAYQLTGSIGSNVVFRLFASGAYRTGKPIIAGGIVRVYYSSDTQPILTGGLQVSGQIQVGTSNHGSLATGGANVDARSDIIVGSTDAGDTHTLDLGTGTHRLAGTLSAVAQSTTTLALNQCRIFNAGTIDGADFDSITAGYGAEVIGGTVQNVTLASGTLRCYGSTDGGGNDANVLFFNSAPPRRLLGHGHPLVEAA